VCNVTLCVSLQKCQVCAKGTEHSNIRVKNNDIQYVYSTKIDNI